MSDENRCDCCGWITDDLKRVDAYARGQNVRIGSMEITADLCYVCRSTMASNVYLYPGQYEQHEITSTIAWGINYLASLIQSKEVQP